MEIVKACIHKNQTAEVLCPHCRGLTRISTNTLQKKYRSRVSCVCQNDFIAEVNFRDKHRKPVDLPGYYTIASLEEAVAETEKSRPSPPVANCQVIDLSRNGIGILVLDGKIIHAGDILHLNFKLDNPSSTDISQRCEVRHVKGTYAGCKMINDNEDLSLYLLARTGL